MRHMLNTRLPTPLYLQLADHLRSEIAEGLVRPGQKIASEHEMAVQFSIGRPTVRQATEQLVSEGLLERRRGSGTYVKEATTSIDMLGPGGTIASLRESGKDFSTLLIEPMRLQAVEDDARNPFHKQQAYTVTRVGSIGTQPAVVESFYFSPSSFPRMDLLYEGDSLSRFVFQQYRLRPLGGTQSFAVVPTVPAIAEQLQFEDSHLLEVRRSLDFPTENNAVYVIIHCNTRDHIFSQPFGNSPC